MLNSYCNSTLPYNSLLQTYNSMCPQSTRWSSITQTFPQSHSNLYWELYPPLLKFSCYRSLQSSHVPLGITHRVQHVKLAIKQWKGVPTVHLTKDSNSSPAHNANSRCFTIALHRHAPAVRKHNIIIMGTARAVLRGLPIACSAQTITVWPVWCAVLATCPVPMAYHVKLALLHSRTAFFVIVHSVCHVH
jgi:hypothetical protein